MNSFQKGLALTIVGAFASMLIVTIAFPAAVTNVQLWFSGTLVSSGNPLPVNVVGGGGGGLSVVDQTVWINGTSDFTPGGGVYNDSATPLSIGNEGTFRMNAHRGQIVDTDTTSNNLYTAITSSIASGTNRIGYTSDDPCAQLVKTNTPISYQATPIAQQIAASGTSKIYVCSLALIASSATTFSIVGGTGTNCGTPTALMGTTVATHGLSLAANGGMTLGNGRGSVIVTPASSELCLVQSGTGDLSGNITYVQQ